MSRLIMIRHGESLANLEGRFTWTVDEPLTPMGVEQARATGEHLSIHFTPKVLYASPFRRAFDTAREIGGIFGLEPQVVEAFREQDFGVFKGQPYANFYGSHAAGSAERWELLPEGGERLREVAERAGAALDRIAEEHAGDEVLVVSHGGVMSALRGWVRADYTRAPTPTRNAWGYVLQWRSGDYRGPIELDDYPGSEPRE